MTDIANWQRRFFAGPKVWWVVDPDGNPTNLYESEEAANIELAWRRERGERGYRVGFQNVHSDALSRERWSRATPPATTPESTGSSPGTATTEGKETT